MQARPDAVLLCTTLSTRYRRRSTVHAASTGVAGRNIADAVTGPQTGSYRPSADKDETARRFETGGARFETARRFETGRARFETGASV